MSDTEVTPPPAAALAGNRTRPNEIRVPGSDSAHHTNPPEILAQNGSQRAARATPPAQSPDPPPNTPHPRKATTVSIRLHGTTRQISATLAAISGVLNIQRISWAYPDRPPSTLTRIHLDAATRPDRKELL